MNILTNQTQRVGRDRLTASLLTLLLSTTAATVATPSMAAAHRGRWSAHRSAVHRAALRNAAHRAAMATHAADAAHAAYPLPAAAKAAAAHAAALKANAAAHAAGTRTLMNRRISLNFNNADIVDILKAISLQSGVNIIFGTDLRGDEKDKALDKDRHLTLNLKNTTVSDALDLIARVSGLSYAKIGSAFVVGSGANIAAISHDGNAMVLTTATIPFFYADGTKLEKSVAAAYPNINVSLVEQGGDVKIIAHQDVIDAEHNFDRGSAAGGAKPDVTRTVDKGGVLNVVGSLDQVMAVRRFVEATEDGLSQRVAQEKIQFKNELDEVAEAEVRHAEAAERVKNSKADEDLRRMAMATEAIARRRYSMATERYAIKYGAPRDLVTILHQLIPTLSVLYGPTQGFTTGSNGASATFAQDMTNSNAASDAAALAGVAGAPGTAGSPPPQNTGTSTTTGGGGAGDAGGGKTSHANTPASLLFNGTPEDIARAHELLAQIDVAVPQLQFEARVVDIQDTDSAQLGLRYDFTQTDYLGESHTSGDPSVGNSTFQARKPGFGSITRAPYAVGISLDALANKNHARTLASPNLSALDGEPATAFIGDQIKFVTSITQGTNGPNVTTDTATVGITLKVTGKSSPDGTITLYVHPEVSTITSYLTLTTGISLPQISSRYVDTTIRVKDGETIAIGGLIQEQDVKNIQKVPLLGDLPFFGQLFRSTTTQKTRSNVVVFITSHVLKN